MFQRKTVRWSAVAAVAAAVVLVVGFWPGKAGRGSGVAFAEVMQRICSARTVTYDSDITSEGPSQPAVHSKVMHMGLGRMRTESLGGTTIMDSSAHKSLALLPATKKAIRLEFVGGPQAPPQATPQATIFDHLLQLRGKASEDLGQQEIDGQAATGFRVKEAGFDWAIWVDPATGGPIRIELTCDAVLGAGTKTVMRNFAFDVPLDESLFSLDPPPGYTLDVQQLDLPATPEQALIDSLRECADVYEGQFPQKFDKHCTEDLEEKINPKKQPAKAMQFARSFGRIFGGLMFVQALPAGSDWHYVGGGVKLGQADMPICWWKPAGSQTYRVLFGDLSVRDLDKAEVDRLTAQISKNNPGG